MSVLASNNVTVTIAPRDREIAGARAGRNITLARVSFGNGVLTYPTGGVPLPPIGAFGFRRDISFVAIEEPAANGFIYKYDSTTHRIRIYTQGVLTGPTAVAAAETGALVRNSAGAETAASPRLPRTTPNTTHDLGPMIEMPAGTAPAAVTLRLLLLGD